MALRTLENVGKFSFGKRIDVNNLSEDTINTIMGNMKRYNTTRRKLINGIRAAQQPTIPIFLEPMMICS